jgi:hypothetical protein
MARRQTPGIFCVEGGWSPKLTDKSSVRPLLEYLEGVGQIRFLHDNVRTVSELVHLIRLWPQRQYQRYSIGYFGFHGVPGRLRIGRQFITLDELAEEMNGSSAGKTIYFGSCSVLDLKRREIEEFRRATKARCVAGFDRDIDWHESAAFDLILFEALTYYRRIDAVDRWLRENYGSLVRRLGFRMVYG